MWRPKSKPKDLEVPKSERPDKVDLRLLNVTMAPNVGLRHLKVPEAPNGARRLLIVTSTVADYNNNNTRMWANAQCDGRPAEHRWRPLFNAAKFG